MLSDSVKTKGRQLGAIALSALALSMAACGSSDSGSGDSGTFSISGSLAVGDQLASVRRSSERVKDAVLIDIIADAHGLPVSPRSTLAASQCTDGNFYQVYCMSFSDTPEAALGAVDCTNGGAFTVDGLPTDTEIGCFIRSSTAADGTFQTVGTIEIPSTETLTGTTGSLVASGDIKFNVTVSSTGTITATLVDDKNLSSTATGTVLDDSKLNATFAVSCLTQAEAGSEFAQDKCQAGGLIDTAVYTATLGQAIDQSANGGPKLSAGQKVKVITVWNHGKRTGGEGLSTMGGVVSWDSTTATNAVTFSTGNVSVPNMFAGGTTNVNLPAVPSATTYLAWQDYARGVVLAFGSVTGFGCKKLDGSQETSGSAINSDAYCFSQVANRIFERLATGDSGVNVPRVHFQGLRDATATNANAVRIFVDGLRPNYRDTWTSSDNYTVGSDDFSQEGPSGAMPSERKVLDMLNVVGSVASFHTGSGYEKRFRCVASSAANGEIANASCTGSEQLVCHLREEMRIDLRLKTGSTTDFRGVLMQNVTSFGGELRGNTGGTTGVPALNANELCISIASGSAQMMIDLIKQ
jgi:hypothetical protein